jgi:hypothetical protein
MRKIIIGLVAIAFVGVFFVGYMVMMDTTPIQAPDTEDVPDLNISESRGGVQQTADTDVRDARDAEYFVFDKMTNKITRTLGFKKLLNPGQESRWQVEGPYLIFYESNYQCRIDADKGIFQTTSGGSGKVPKDAQLDGNVVIHLTPKPGSRMSETFIKMDDLTFSSERSEFATDGPVSIRSDQIELDGYGLILLFDTAVGRVDYLHIRDLEKLRILNFSGPKVAIASRDSAKTAPATPLVAVSAQPSYEEPQATEGVADSQKTASSADYYECVLDENVEIHYGNEIVVKGADQIDIQHILLSKLDSGASADASSGSEDRRLDAPQKPDRRSNQTVQTPHSDESAKEVRVKCDGGIILRPMQSQVEGPQQAAVKFKSDTAETAPPTLPNLADDTVLEAAWGSENPPPAKFEAWKIDYDLLTGTGLAHGPVRFTFCQPSDSNDTGAASWNPVIVTADRNAQFIADASRTINQIVFNENVMATRRSKPSGMSQIDNFHGDRLSIFLDKNEKGETDVSAISMTDGKVYAQSRRFKDEQTLFNVRLSCAEIAYDHLKKEILAKGPNGEIQLDNSHVSDAAISGKSMGVDFSKPCYVYGSGFDSIEWDLAEQKITANGQQDQLKLAYIPLVNGAPDKFIYVNSIRFALDFITDSTGKTVLKRVFTDKPVTYEELNSDQTKQLHNIEGQKLVYDTVDTNGWVKIEGTPAMPVNVDNVRTPFVYIHPATGQLETSLSNLPGVLNVP